MPLETTYRIFAASPHPEVVDVLGRGAESDDIRTRQQCFRLLAHRNDVASHDALIQRWDDHRDQIIEALTLSSTNTATEYLPHEEIPFVQTVLDRLSNLDCLDKHEGHHESEGHNPNRALNASGGHLASIDSSDANSCNDEVMIRVAVDIVTVLSVMDALPSLIRLATEHPSHVVREDCVDAVLSLSQTWGRQARRNYAGQRTNHHIERNRLAVTYLLFQAVVQFHSHRQEGLLDALLVLVTWNDPCLRSAFDDDTPCRTLMLRRLKNSRRQNVMELLAGYLRRRNIPACVLSLLLQRRDATYREILLEVISSSPSATTLSNLKEYGLPDCLRGGVETLRELGTDRDAAVANAYSMAMQQDPETIAVLLDIIDRHQSDGTSLPPNPEQPPKSHATDVKEEDDFLGIATITLSRCELPSINYWLEGFGSPIMDGADFQEMSRADSNADRAAKICRRLIAFSQVDDSALSKAAGRLLGELTIQNAISLFPKISTEKRLRLGRTLMQIDPSTLDVVKDGLRHAVMQRRLDAIEFARTLGLVDLMIDPLSAIARNDHQTVRIAAAKAFGSAIGESSEDLLKELSCSPQGSVRDAANASMQARGLPVS